MREQLEALVQEMHRRGIQYSEAVREFKRAFVSGVLRINNGNQLRSARLLGMHRNTLSRTIVQLDIDLEGLRPAARRRPPQAERQLPRRKSAAAAGKRNSPPV
jgi:Fis family transcriptional regulator, factor for inversion stimulation protein